MSNSVRTRYTELGKWASVKHSDPVWKPDFQSRETVYKRVRQPFPSQALPSGMCSSCLPSGTPRPTQPAGHAVLSPEPCTLPWGQRLGVCVRHFHRPQGGTLVFPVCDCVLEAQPLSLTPCASPVASRRLPGPPAPGERGCAGPSYMPAASPHASSARFPPGSSGASGLTEYAPQVLIGKGSRRVAACPSGVGCPSVWALSGPLRSEAHVVGFAGLVCV